MGNQANVEYFFRLLYDCLHGGCYVSVNFSGASAFLAGIWLWVVLIGYALSIVALVVIVYCMIRLYALREREEHEYGQLLVAPEAAHKNTRWQHIEALIASENSSDWRQAIIEADIMLDDVLGRQGYGGLGVGEKLKGVERADMNTLRDAQEAHGVRNRIAHQGSAYDLSELLARRTIARYESVFREFEAI